MGVQDVRTILVDIDDVLINTTDVWTQILNQRYNLNVKEKDIKEWDMTKAFPTLEPSQIFSVLNEKIVWESTKPIGNAVDILEILNRDHNVYLVTATCAENVDAKWNLAVKPFFTYLNWNQVIVAKNKDLIRGDIIIDDNPDNLVNREGKKFLFNRSHNLWFDCKSINNCSRVDNWTAIYREIEV